MSVSTLPPIPPNIASLTGPPLMGILFNWGLFGALSVQTYIYSQSFAEDRKWMKGLVYGLYALEIVQTALATGDALQWFAIGFGDMVSLSKPWYSALDAPLFDGVIALVVQLFFCWRIWVLSRSWPLAGTIGLISLAGNICGMVSGIRTMMLDDVTMIFKVLRPYLLTWFACSALSDTLIAGTMVFVLLRQLSGQAHSEDIVRRIVNLTVETNALTAIVATIGLILALASPESSMTMTPCYIMGKLYTNTLLVIFNNRIFLTKSQQGAQTLSSRRISTFQPATPTTADEFKIEIYQETEVDVDRDVELGNLENKDAKQ